jgi:hypothetical protein
VSTHLGVLIRACLIQVERARRTMNYRADVPAFRSLVSFRAHDCCNGRSELCGDIARLIPRDDNDHAERFMTPTFNVLFSCTRDSARSIIAEAQQPDGMCLLPKTTPLGAYPLIIVTTLILVFSRFPDYCVQATLHL